MSYPVSLHLIMHAISFVHSETDFVVGLGVVVTVRGTGFFSTKYTRELQIQVKLLRNMI